jgi:hypothetical protein
MNKRDNDELITLNILAKSVEHFIEEAAVGVESELCSRCPKDIRKCRKPCLGYQQNFDIAMSRLISMTAQWN